MSVYLPDDLAERARAFDPDSNVSRVIQVALRRMFETDASGPGYAQRPADAAEALEHARLALTSAAQADYQAGYAAALGRLPEIPWRSIDDFAEHDFDLGRWLELKRRGISSSAARGGLEGVPEWWWSLAEDLGDSVDPLGIDQLNFHRSGAFRRGYRDALRDAFLTVEHGATPSAESQDATLPEAPFED